MENLLLLLAVAACPLMMWLMMRSMHGNKGEQETQPADDRQKTARLKDEVAHIRQEVARAQAESAKGSSDKPVG